jgi:hypothetical protein
MKIIAAKAVRPISTVMPTLSCDHLNCFWLGNVPPAEVSALDSRSSAGAADMFA